MSDAVLTVLIVTILRALVTGAGLTFCILGYKLFVKGVYEKGGELKAAWGDKNLALKQAGPGTFFALFGLLVVGIGIWRDTGLTITPTTQLEGKKSNVATTARVLLPTLDELVSKHGIKPDKMGKWSYSLLWNIYLNAVALDLSNSEIDRLFEVAVKPAAQFDEGKENLPALTTCRDQLFKNLSRPSTPSQEFPAPPKYGKGGVGLD